MGGSSAYRPRTEVEKLIGEISRAQIQPDVLNNYPLTLNCTFEELRALIEFVDKFIKQKRPGETDADRILLCALEALAEALPGPPP
jgi:hypothetical protein